MFMRMCVAHVYRKNRAPQRRLELRRTKQRRDEEFCDGELDVWCYTADSTTGNACSTLRLVGQEICNREMNNTYKGCSWKP